MPPPRLGGAMEAQAAGKTPSTQPTSLLGDSAWPLLQWTLGAYSEPSRAAPDIQPDRRLLTHLTAHVSDGIPLSFSPKVFRLIHLGALTEAPVISRSCERGDD